MRKCTTNKIEQTCRSSMESLFGPGGARTSNLCLNSVNCMKSGKPETDRQQKIVLSHSADSRLIVFPKESRRKNWEAPGRSDCR